MEMISEKFASILEITDVYFALGSSIQCLQLLLNKDQHTPATLELLSDFNVLRSKIGNFIYTVETSVEK